jgi:hypothetical protein
LPGMLASFARLTSVQTLTGYTADFAVKKYAVAKAQGLTYMTWP